MADSGGSPISVSRHTGLSMGFYPPTRCDGSRTREHTSMGGQFRQSDAESSVSEGAKCHTIFLGKNNGRQFWRDDPAPPLQALRKQEPGGLHIGAPAFSPPNANEQERLGSRFQLSYSTQQPYGPPDSGFTTFPVRAGYTCVVISMDTVFVLKACILEPGDFKSKNLLLEWKGLCECRELGNVMKIMRWPWVHGREAVTPDTII
jgi:hypothetical protein